MWRERGSTSTLQDTRFESRGIGVCEAGGESGSRKLYTVLIEEAFLIKEAFISCSVEWRGNAPIEVVGMIQYGNFKRIGPLGGSQELDSSWVSPSDQRHLGPE